MIVRRLIIIITGTLTARGASLIKNLFSLFLFFSFYSWSVTTDLGSFELQKTRFLVAEKTGEDDPIFNEKDLEEIEGGDFEEGQTDDDLLLQQEFNDITKDQSETNFDPDNFDAVDTNTNQNPSKDESAVRCDEESFNDIECEIISDRPGYEILTDDELVRVFEGKGEGEGEGDSFSDNADDLNIGDDSGKDSGEALDDGLSIQNEIIGTEEFEGQEEDEKDVKSSLQKLDSNDSGLGEEPRIEKEPFADDTPSDDTSSDDTSSDDTSSDDISSDDTSSDDTSSDDTSLDDTSLDDTSLDDTSLDDSISLDETPEETDSQADLFENEEVAEVSLNLITNIRYLIETDQIVIDSSEIPTYEERMNDKNNQLIIEIFQAKLGKNLHWPYIMRDFDTHFGLLKADQKDSNTVRVIVQLKPEAPLPPVKLMEDGRIVVGEAKMSSSASLEEGGGESFANSKKALPHKTLKDLYFGAIDYVGTPISFHVIDADVRQVLRFISEESGINMVIDEEVKGKVTLKLEDVPWDQSLHTIFKVHSLGYHRDGNIITILPLKKIQEQTDKLKSIADAQKTLSPFQTKVISIMHAKAQDVEAKVKDFSTPAVQGGKGGRIIVHEQSNSLVVIDNKEAIEKIEKLAKFLDYPSQQLMIESKIVEVTKDFNRDFGLRWDLGGNLPVRIAANGLLDFVQNTFNNAGGTWSVQDRGTTNTFSLNGLPFIGNIGAVLNLAESDGTARVLNTTKILVENGKNATVTRNTPIQIRTSETQGVLNNVQSSGTTTETFTSQDVKLSSNITPTVTSSGNIAMNVQMTLSNPGPGGDGPTTIERDAKTEIIAKNGQTLVLSGIYQALENQRRESIPFLGKIPLLGRIFNNSELRTAESEMLMFITPTLIENE